MEWVLHDIFRGTAAAVGAAGPPRGFWLEMEAQNQTHLGVWFAFHVPQLEQARCGREEVALAETGIRTGVEDVIPGFLPVGEFHLMQRFHPDKKGGGNLPAGAEGVLDHAHPVIEGPGYV